MKSHEWTHLYLWLRALKTIVPPASGLTKNAILDLSPHSYFVP